MRQFEQKKATFDFTVFILEKVFAFIFVRVILGAMAYHQSYLTKMDFQNHYITEYFARIDRRRKQSSKVGILPLRCLERPHLVNLDSPACTRQEFRSILSYLISLVFLVFAVTFFMLMDNIFYETLSIVARHSQVQYDQQGYHDVNITVTGTGVIANLIRRSLDGFDSRERLKLLTSNDECLPRPTKLRTWFIVKTYLLLLGVGILTANEAYINRLRRLICAWFYSKREKQRVLYLYNRLLKRRKGLVKILLERVRQTIRRRKYSSRLDFLDRLVFYYPTCCRWIALFNRKSCSICSTKNPKRFEDCVSSKCFLTYCDECWQDLGETCLACKAGAYLAHDDCALDH